MTNETKDCLSIDSQDLLLTRQIDKLEVKLQEHSTKLQELSTELLQYADGIAKKDDAYDADGNELFC